MRGEKMPVCSPLSRLFLTKPKEFHLEIPSRIEKKQKQLITPVCVCVNIYKHKGQIRSPFFNCPIAGQDLVANGGFMQI